MSIDLALVGATGLVGEAILEQLAHRDLPVGELFVLASENSEGKSLRVGKKSLQVRKAEDFDFSRVQLAVFAAGAAVSQELAPRAADAATVQLLLALKPLMALGDLTRVTVTQMQSASSSGRVGVERLARQSARLLNGLEASEGPESQYAFNMLPMAGRRQDNGYTSEELKVMLEARRVLGQPQLALDVSCVQVPVFHGLSQTVVVQGTMPITLAQAEACWRDAPGLQLDADDEADGASPVRQIRADLGVRIARVREDIDGQGDLSFWTVADNIKTGAAYNAVLLVEKLLKDYL